MGYFWITLLETPSGGRVKATRGKLQAGRAFDNLFCIDLVFKAKFLTTTACVTTSTLISGNFIETQVIFTLYKKIIFNCTVETLFL